MERNTLIQPEIILTSLSLDIFKPDSIDLKLDRFKHIYLDQTMNFKLEFGYLDPNIKELK